MADNNCDGLIDCEDESCSGLSCNDNQFCTVSDTCVEGECIGQERQDCLDDCDEENDICTECYSDNDCLPEHKCEDGICNQIPNTTTTTVFSSGGGGGGSSPSGNNEPILYVMDESINLGSSFNKWTFIIGNALKSGTVQWEIGDISYNNNTGWITSFEPRSGEATYDKPDIVTVNINREGYIPGNYSAVIPVKSRETAVDVLISMKVMPLPPTPDLEPECTTDADCDNKIFCDGEEKCFSGECAGGETPCSEEDICMEDLDQCWGVEKLTALSLQKTIQKPGIRSQKCLWIVIGCEEKNNYDESASAVVITGPEESSRGVTIDPARNILKAWNFILVPVCVEKDAAAGQWTVKIQTDVSSTNKPYKEVIESVFEVE